MFMSVNCTNKSIEKLECKGTEKPDFDESLVAAFERVAVNFPSRIAVSSDAWESTYRELNETANRLAHRLIACGFGLGDRAAILMAHDAPMVAAVLGILKAGQIVVALDPGEPVARLKTLVEDAEPSIIVTDVQNEILAAEFAHSGCQILNFESENAFGPVENPAIEIPPEQTAFVTYTSGTTGRPKGVMQTHRQLRRAAAAHTEAMQYTENDRIPLFAMVSTGQGSVGLCWILLNGAMLCPFPLKTRGVTGLAEWIIDRGLTVYVSSASIFRMLVKTIDDGLVFSKVRAIRLASEAVTADDFREFQKHFPPTSVLVHGLSSSETSNIAWARWTQGDKIPEGVLPVGHFSREMDIALVGDDGQPVAQGEIGEIVVTSRYVAAGYWRDPGLTADRFSDDLDGKGTRRVRNGDLGRINANGLLDFIGRKDDRIKIRGNRIEPPEIERTLERLPGIDRAAVVAIRRENHEPVLVAFVVKTSNASWTPQRLRHAMRANLPLHMVPSRIVFLDALPYNRGNKIDREVLRHYTLPNLDDSNGEKPRTETEILLADIWAEILELPEISVDTDFFNLGGDSLRGAVVAARIHAAFGIELTLGAIADHPTISTLAAFIDERRSMVAAGAPPIVRVPRGASMPLSSFQEGQWNFSEGQQASVMTNRIVGPLDVEIFKQCLNYLVDRHEILRTTFSLVEGCPAQIIHSSAPLDFSFIDLIGADDANDQADLIFREAASQAIDLTKLPIMRYVLVRVASDCYRLARISHFLISDGFSGRILDDELASLYEAMLQGCEPPLPRQAPLQYADYAVWQRQAIRTDGPYFKGVMNWWKTVFSTAPPAARLPFRRLTHRTNLDANEGVLRWTLEECAAKRLDEIARRVATTHFIIRLAAFVALIADLIGNSTVVIGTYFQGRNRTDAQTIVGRFVNRVPLVFSYDASKTFLEWLEIVHNRVFETLAHSGLPFDKIHEQLRTSGIEPPEIQIYFILSRDHLDQHFGNLVISHDSSIIGTMPSGCKFYVDEKNPDNCHAYFDAGLYGRNEIHALLDRYLRLLEAAAREPELSIGKLQMKTGAKPLRWAYANYGWAFYEFLKPYYDSSPLLLKACWRCVKRWIW
jgi:amino acid adenylation domain-containing protein